MTSREVLIDEMDGRMAAALLEDGKVINLYVDPPGNTPLPGSIYLAEVARIDPGQQAAYLNLGDGAEGYLSSSDINLPGNRKHTIESLQTGAKIVVQIKSTGDETDSKLPGMTMKVQYLNPEDEQKLNPAGPPHRLHPGLNAALRMLRDYTKENIQNIDIHEKYAKEIMAFCDAYANGATINKVADALFDVRDVWSCLDSLKENTAPLKSGGNIVIETTKALTAIDVNSGIDSNLLNTNLEAAWEIARQIRLRGIGGIFVIDFLKTDSKGDKIKIEDTLKKATLLDRNQIDLHGFTKLGLYELTRKKI